MKQVQLKIEEFFNGEISYRLNNLFFDECKLDEIENIISKNESRETIIKALWDFQKSLLPKNYHIDKLDLDCYVRIYKKGYEQLKFYNPDTRIITITEFN